MPSALLRTVVPNWCCWSVVPHSSVCSVLLLLFLLPSPNFANSALQSADEKVLLEELIREMRLLGHRAEEVLRRGIGSSEEQQLLETKRAAGVAPSVLWNGGGDKRAQLPFSGGIYGKRSPLLISGGIYGKRGDAIARLTALPLDSLERQSRAMPFNGGMYGK